MEKGKNRDHLDSERPHPASAELDRLGTGEALGLFLEENAVAGAAVAGAREEIAAAIDLVAERLGKGGRLFYVGAGTSGRLGVLDAVECPPTFLTDGEMVQGVIAGGTGALLHAIEGAEDSSEGGAAALDERGVGSADVVLGITAGGTTPFVHGAIARARELRAATVFLACVSREAAPDEAEISIRLATGPELLAGSTRLKAGTATKMVLNAISTLTMVRLGKTFGNLMVDVNTRGSAKLHERGISILRRITAIDRPTAVRLLEETGGEVKVAALMQARGVDLETARARLEACDGHLRRALE
jgi:N-acetylmuramic acid 6-phosphate etherase